MTQLYEQVLEEINAEISGYTNRQQNTLQCLEAIMEIMEEYELKKW